MRIKRACIGKVCQCEAGLTTREVFTAHLTDMRNDVLNASIIQLVYLGGIIIQDREGHQQGIYC